MSPPSFTISVVPYGLSISPPSRTSDVSLVIWMTVLPGVAKHLEGDLLDALGHIRDDNVQGEYYITDAPGVLVGQGKKVRALPVLKPIEPLGENTFNELAAAETALKAEAGE